ncbi:MAG: ArdC-like ssDNA-binding domain-containing protein [Cellulophaga sp.]
MEIVKNSKDTAIDTTLQDNTDIYSQVFGCKDRDEKKELLSNISTGIKVLVELGEYENVNQGILDLYRNENHTEFHTFKKWKELGYKVVKGKKAFFIWSRPIKVTHKATEKEKQENKADKEFKFFGLAHLFSNAQVELLEPKR